MSEHTDDAAGLREIEGRLDDIEAALERLDAGSYATCQSCGRVIAPERLYADPTTPWCEQCAAPAEPSAADLSPVSPPPAVASEG